MKKFFKDFKAFISRGNVVDLAVGVIIGGAFTAIVTALTGGILRPIINYIVFACTGGKSVNLITILNGKSYLIDDGAGKMVVNPECIYIDWGMLIIAIIDFILIAIVLFCIIKAFMASQNVAKKAREGKPTKEEKKELKAKGVNLKDKEATKKALVELRESKKVVEPAKPTTEELLQAILNEIKAK